MRVQSSPRKRCRSAAGRGQACSFVYLVSCSFTRHASMLSPSDGQPRTRRPARLGLQLTRRPDKNPVMRATISVARLRGGVPSHTLVSRLPPRPIRPARRDIILHGRDELLATAREMGLFEQRSIAPTSTALRWFKSISAMYECVRTPADKPRVRLLRPDILHRAHSSLPHPLTVLFLSTATAGGRRQVAPLVPPARGLARA
jgi:hypothetical protein